MDRLKPTVWAVVVGALAAALAVRAWGAHGGAVDLQRRTIEADRRVQMLTAENRRLKGEIEALNGDPLYLEKLLRQNQMIGANEERRP